MIATERANAIEWAKLIAAHPNTVYLDTETTGLENAEIVDIAVIGREGETLIDTLVRPSVAIPEAASAVHRIFAADVAGAKTWAEVGPDVLAVLEGRTVCVFNSAYDLGIVRYCCMLAGLPEPAGPWECAMKAYGAFNGERSKKGPGFRWHKLDAAVAHFGGNPGGHRALGDALACREVVLGMAKS